MRKVFLDFIMKSWDKSAIMSYTLFVGNQQRCGMNYFGFDGYAVDFYSDRSPFETGTGSAPFLRNEEPASSSDSRGKHHGKREKQPKMQVSLKHHRRLGKQQEQHRGI